MTLYKIVKEILERSPKCRNSDKSLIWNVWNRKTLVMINERDWRVSHITYLDYMNAPSSESITRARRKVQEDFPELRSSKEVQKMKDLKEATKGDFVHTEQA